MSFQHFLELQNDKSPNSTLQQVQYTILVIEQGQIFQAYFALSSEGIVKISVKSIRGLLWDQATLRVGDLVKVPIFIGGPCLSDCFCLLGKELDTPLMKSYTISAVTKSSQQEESLRAVVCNYAVRLLRYQGLTVSCTTSKD